MSQKFELGPLQKEWVAELRAHPERQIDEMLGYQDDDGNIRACCLGQAYMIVCQKQDKTPFGKLGQREKVILDSGDSSWFKSFDIMGLADEKGTVVGHEQSLADMNDAGKTWPEIADFIEANPEKVFTKSV